MDLIKGQNLDPIARAIRSRAANLSGTVYVIGDDLYTKFDLTLDRLTPAVKEARPIKTNLDDFLMNMEVEKDGKPILGYLIKGGIQNPNDYDLTEVKLCVNVAPFQMYVRNKIHEKQIEREIQGGVYV